ncbi:MAG: 4-hydroxy-tetrahydrodipicolinate synthase [Deltaproteobacteria bacterium]|nr:4-hydroxy-tetrahydrodipicolinate synthase [Deltaproteobacteria bacterium]
MFKGSIVAIVTPFSNGKIDKKALSDLVKWHIRHKTDAIVVNGTTGETPTLSREEQKENIYTVLEASESRIPIIAGVGSNSTEHTIDNAKTAISCGVDGLLVVTPYYNKPTQEGMYQHFLKISELSPTPVILYNVPGRTGVTLKTETVLKLAEQKNIVGIKEAGGDFKMVTELSSLLKKFDILCGDDALNLPMAAAGSNGAISVTANVVPHLMSKMYRLIEKGDFSEARKIHQRLRHLNSILFVESNPIPVKAALSLMKKIKNELRLPLMPISDENMKKLKTVIDKNYPEVYKL